MLVELALIVGGVLILKNRKKRKAEDRARQEQEFYNSRPGSVSAPPPPPPQQPFNPYTPPASPAPQQKPPVMYGATSSTPRPFTPGQPYSGEQYPNYAPPAYAALQPQNDALGYERQGRNDQGDRKSRGLFHRS
ncbi:hypothetical protein Dda_6595 [Drechslerella dactyloides]|uniref:Uncharacterized protein n=1 Tax=Drechslerella dactyloides TaxID=74499 RepID=A0AAD6NGC3_DREDA|nr:hypothetical protein Dda_6595 [Drechslerella dactyloides]